MQPRKVCIYPDFGSVKFLHDMRIKASTKLTPLHSMLKVLHREGHSVLIFFEVYDQAGFMKS